jgi:hypothetical protein
MLEPHSCGKVAVRIDGEEVSLPLGGALCMTLAAHMNLPAAKVETRKVEDVEYLLVERYDRKHVTIDGEPTVEHSSRGFLPSAEHRL